MKILMYEKIMCKLGKNSAQNYIFNLGYALAERGDYTNDIDQILDNGALAVTDIIRRKMVKITRRAEYVDIEPNETYVIQSKDRVYPISNEAIKMINTDIYLAADGKYRATVIEHYAYKRINSLDRECARVLEKLNNLALTVNPEVLDYTRRPKSDKIDDNYLMESEFMRLAIKSQIGKEYFTGHRFDSRGRMYNDCYTLNYQGDEYNKCAVNPAKSYKVTKANKKYLQHDLANHYGLDKETFEVKEQWVKDNINNIISEASNNSLDSEFMKQADKPMLFKKACKAYYKAMLNKEINYFVYNDATSSGPQILSILSNDHKMAKLTNLIDNKQCYDLYGEITQEFIDRFNLPFKVKQLRKYFKKITMTYFYNSKATITQQLKKMREDYPEIAEIDDLDEIEIESFLRTFTNGCFTVMDEINKVFDNLPNTTKEIEFVMPDGFVVTLPLIKKKMKRIKTPYFNLSIRYDINAYDREQNWRSFVPNAIHSIDSFIAREVIRKCDFEVLCIHDSFGCSANNVKKLKKVYTDTLKRIQSMNLLEFILKQIDPTYQAPRFDKQFKIASNNYAIC